MNDHVIALLYFVLGNVMVLLYYVEKLVGQGLFARMLALISSVFFFVAAARVVINM